MIINKINFKQFIWFIGKKIDEKKKKKKKKIYIYIYIYIYAYMYFFLCLPVAGKK